MDADQSYKNKIGQRLAETLVNAFESGKISSEDASYLATYIREEYAEKEQDSSTIFTFLEQLSQDWPIFSHLLYENSNPPVPEAVPEEDTSTQIQNISSLIQEAADEQKNQQV